MSSLTDPTLESRIGVLRTWVCDLTDYWRYKYEHPLTEEEVEDYKALTNLEEHEIYGAFDLFAFQTRKLEEPPSTSLRFPCDSMFRRIPAFFVCPFQDRLRHLFSYDGENFTFCDWLDMFNSFHKNTPTEYKLEIAFRLFDFDDDGFLSLPDVIEYLKRLTSRELEDYEYHNTAIQIIQHYDYDLDGKIGLDDFKLGMLRDDDFKDKFLMSTRLIRDLRML